jgi:hypothetical protein
MVNLLARFLLVVVGFYLLTGKVMKKLVICFFYLFSISTQAGIITLDLDWDDQEDFYDGELQSGDQAFSGPLMVTFDDLITSNGDPEAEIDQDGFYFSRSSNLNFYDIISVSLSFNMDVRLLNVDIDYDENSQNGEFWFVEGIKRSGNMLGKVGNITYDAGTIPFFKADTKYTIYHNLTGDDLFQIDELILETIEVPEPASLSFMLLSLYGCFSARRKKC